MPGPKPPTVQLTDAERESLKKLVNRHKTGQQIALRGRIVLAAAEGKNNAEIAREYDVSVPTVRLWRQRWIDLQRIPLPALSAKDRLEDLPRPGAPRRITAERRFRIATMACEKPKEWRGWEIVDLQR